MSEKLNAKGVKRNSGTYVSKDLNPGQVLARIVGMAVKKRDQPKDPKVPEYEICIKLEGPKFEDPATEGWLIDNNRPEKGRYQGPFKEIRSGNWPIKDFTYKKKDGSSVTKTANDQIINFFQELCEAYGQKDLLDTDPYQQDLTTSEFIKQLNADLKFKNHYIWFLLAGTKARNKKNPKYWNFYLYLADFKQIEPGKRRIAAKQEDLSPFTDDMIYINPKDLAASPGNSEHVAGAGSPEDLDEFQADEESFGTTDMGVNDDQTLFEQAASFDEDFGNAPEDDEF